ncbi:BMP family lipoprotein [Diplocloster agilis]|uniref:BMP family lipoprotein n=1 Tax=Diplocloster agilis TaxID=2850323 RepID=UPI0008204C9F|nr:BMP family ABC transporter substrate-binding protein [Suonthocola fibrivorans]MCU6735781.1 BMP family ABC transporter substrate-binding protein [Suonthocola fibrivorans]SCJ81651.1 Basic membrane protein [uncultured Clostridium sp.]
MRKRITVLLAIVMALSLSACGGNSDNQMTREESANTEKTGASEEAKKSGTKENQVAIILQEGGLGDQGYNDSAKVGFDRMVEKYGIDGVLIEAAAPAEADTFIRQLAEDGYPLIICLDWTIIDYVKEASTSYPDTYFVVLGKTIPGGGEQENLIEPYTALNEWAFMAEVAMVELTKDGNEMFDWQSSKPGVTVGYIAAGESVQQSRPRSAFQQLRQWYKDEEGIDVTLIEDYTASYTDSALNQQIAENMVKNNGVEAFWCVCGTGALATYSTAKQLGVYALGNDSFQDDVEPGAVATSVLHDTTYMVTNIIDAWQSGTLNGKDEYYWGVASGVVGLTDMSYIKSVEGCDQEAWERVTAAINEWKDKLISGEFLVYNYFLEQELNPGTGEFKDWQAAHPGVDYTQWVKAGRPE